MHPKTRSRFFGEFMQILVLEEYVKAIVSMIRNEIFLWKLESPCGQSISETFLR